MDTETNKATEISSTMDDNTDSFEKVKTKKSQKRRREMGAMEMESEDTIARKRPQFPPISGDKLTVAYNPLLCLHSFLLCLNSFLYDVFRAAYIVDYQLIVASTCIMGFTHAHNRLYIMLSVVNIHARLTKSEYICVSVVCFQT